MEFCPIAYRPIPEERKVRPTYPGQEVDELAAVASERSSTEEVLERTLSAAREHLGMDVAFVAQFSGDRLAFRSLAGCAPVGGHPEILRTP